MGTPKNISIIMPCRNEEKYIGKVLDNIESQDYPADHIEILIGDGASDDDTRAIIEERQKTNNRIRLIDNPERTVPYALNRAIKAATGDLVIRLDAHSEYPDDYVSRLVRVSVEYDADNVGGVWNVHPGADTPMAEAIAMATSSPFGVGNADYRMGGKEIKEVDTVPYGCYKKEVFDRIGLFDEELTRNQDDEFNGRLRENGGRIFIIPDLQIEYYARPDLGKLAKMFYQYALYKPLVNQKLQAPATMRQFAPLILVLAIGLGWLPALLWPWMGLVYAAGVISYLTLALLLGIKVAVSNGRPRLWWRIFIIFVSIHMSYGWGYVKGLMAFTLGRKKGKDFHTSIAHR